MSVRLSLKYRIAVMILLLEAIMMGLVLWKILGHSYAASSQQIAANEQAMLDVVSGVSRVALLTEEYADLQPYLEDLKKNPSMIRVMLADVQGRVVAGTRPEDVGPGLPALIDEGDYFWRTQEITNAAGPLGVLAMEFSNAALLRAYAEARNLGISIAAIGMSIIAIAGALTGFLLTRRLERITVAAQRFARGELAVETGVQGHDELGELAQSFDEMARSVAENQRHMQESENYNRMLFEQSPVGLALCRMNGELVDINPAYAGIIGRSVEEALKLTYWDVTPGKYAKDEQRQLEILNNTGHYGPYEKEAIRKDGHLVPVRLQGLFLEKGGEGFILSSVEDITERKQAEDALRRAQKMEAIGRLSGGVAHDFNNQLGIIIGYLDYLQNHFPENAKPRQWVETATKATLRCMDLTRQLLTFSRQQSKEKVVVDLNVLLKELENVIARSVTPEVEVQYFLAPDLASTEIDPGEFQDAILNLVINARDAMPSGGKLLIETTNKHLDAAYAALNPGVEPGDYTQLMLSDTGAGMDKETLEHVFEPFFTTKPEGQGTGLGLAMVYGFVKRYGGNIKVYSEPGVGTTIRIYLPHSKTSEPATSTTDTRTEVLPTGSETILIVDDEDDLLQLADQYLSSLGYRTRLAENAAQAMEILAAEEEIDLLFSDVVMPGEMNGYELAQQATEKRPGLKVLMTSGYSAKTVANNGLARFAAHLLGKPYRKAELAQRIRFVLDEALEKDNLTGRTILVIDDEEDVRELFKLNLEGLGCKTVPASNGEDAIDLYQRSLESGEPIDVIILDLAIPGSMGGNEVADKIRALDPQAKMIVSSGHSGGAEMTRYQDYGFQGALEKDFNRQKIKQALEQVLTSG